jgi:hypothetical protein
VAMPETDEKDKPRVPKVHSGEAPVRSETSVITDADRYTKVNIDSPLPSPLKWLENALARLKATPDCPQEITEAARRLESEMAEAFRRRQVDATWGRGHIKNMLTTLGLWKRTRTPKP